ncbi:MAG TPA: hypothetical protein VHF07_07335 [Nitrospiraceae bacterium]|nr:hypothetical protein [Nitrospiraceae bacterium]
MNVLARPEHRSSRPAWHGAFAQGILYLLAPVVLLSGGFFTANFIVSGLYSWPRTSRVFALTLTLAVFAYEFVYKEQRARAGSHDRALLAVLYSCLIPYAVGILMMLALAKL